MEAFDQPDLAVEAVVRFVVAAAVAVAAAVVVVVVMVVVVVLVVRFAVGASAAAVAAAVVIAVEFAVLEEQVAGTAVAFAVESSEKTLLEWAELIVAAVVAAILHLSSYLVEY